MVPLRPLLFKTLLFIVLRSKDILNHPFIVHHTTKFSFLMSRLPSKAV
jgi:hypothetical protein